MPDTSYTLECYFKNAGDETIKKNFPFVDPEDMDDTSVKALCDAIVTNKALFKDQPVSKVSARVLTKSYEDYDISDD